MESLGRIWNWQLEQQVPAKIELTWPASKLLKVCTSDMLSGPLQTAQNVSDDKELTCLKLFLFWRLLVAKGTPLLSFKSGILLKLNGVSLPAVLTIVDSREGFSSYERKYNKISSVKFCKTVLGRTSGLTTRRCIFFLTQKQSLELEGEIRAVPLEVKLFPCLTKIARKLNTQTCLIAAHSSDSTD